MLNILLISKMKYISRNIYLTKIQPFINKDLIKVFTGQRRVGKSYILYQLMDIVKVENPKADIIYINKELNEFSAINNSDDLYGYIKSKSNKNKFCYLFIDEIQEITQFEKALRSLLAEDNYDIYCTGNNASMLSGDISTYLTGRYIEINIHSLAYSEFLQFHKLFKGKDSFQQYMKYGGMPYLIHLTFEDQIINEYLSSIYSTILLKDIVKRYNIRNVYLLEKLVEFLSNNIGSIFSAKKISDFLKSQKINLSVKVILEYLSHLEDAFFISKVKRMDIEGKKIFEIGEKIYFEDIGLRNVLNPYNPKDIGKILENLVYHHLKVYGWDVRIGVSGEKEIDFIGTKDSQKIYIQVVYQIPDEKTHKREFGNLLQIHDNYQKYVITLDDFAEGDYRGIKYINAIEFLSVKL